MSIASTGAFIQVGHLGSPENLSPDGSPQPRSCRGLILGQQPLFFLARPAGAAGGPETPHAATRGQFRQRDVTRPLRAGAAPRGARGFVPAGSVAAGCRSRARPFRAHDRRFTGISDTTAPLSTRRATRQPAAGLFGRTFAPLIWAFLNFLPRPPPAPAVHPAAAVHASGLLLPVLRRAR